ncbi:Rieske (2Fe-2S) protein [Cytophagaceae bacterium YF14B1]|uniref:Rieske (2Fe-2S) protein n=1 Tax=Xanthocytophaga flava TaxID=3048013 RepID=A0AAE3UBN9_9BACT|nr:Rieske (2Fe-2S) protein [Xanthocytophaga flavus]MDJ1485972.1 Rieske (2Fe-2S) protein [Xanthocytophaga flavus]
MKRLPFIKTCMLSCMALTKASFLLPGCAGLHSVQGKMEESTPNGKILSFLRSEFTKVKKNGQHATRTSLLLTHPQLKFPIVVFDDGIGDDGMNRYTALWLECTHQGNEVNVQGNILSCPGHGSEFDRTGKVIQGPAKKALHAFEVKTDSDSVFIVLA